MARSHIALTQSREVIVGTKVKVKGALSLFECNSAQPRTAPARPAQVPKSEDRERELNLHRLE